MKKKTIAQYVVNLIDMGISGLLMYMMYWCLPKNIWIISERLDQAQDNGIAFFEYLNQCHPEIQSYYLLEKGNKNIEAVKKTGEVIIQGSLKHKLYFLKSIVIATTEKNMIEPWGSNVFYKYFARYYPTKLRVFLQHGILCNDVSSVYGKDVSHFDLFVTSSRLEKDFVVEKFGYSQEEIANVGISRYDQLTMDKKLGKKENIILYMPTWRRYLIDLTLESEEYLEEVRREFIHTNYYQEIDSFINNKYLENILGKYDYKMIMITHHAMNRLKGQFKAKNSRVEAYQSEDVDIKTFLKKCRVFITDYSSIHFDSAYIGNMNIYYQFDRENFRQGHAGGSYFEYSEDGFGEVVETLPELLEQIEIGISQKGRRPDLYTQRVDRFFEFRDGLNCERLYQSIDDSLNKRGRKRD